MSRCPNCSHEAPDGSKYCPRCSAHLADSDTRTSLPNATHRGADPSSSFPSSPGNVRFLLGPGDSFGETGLLRAAPRNATVLAGDDGTAVLRVPGEAFQRLLERSPESHADVVATMLERLGEATRHH